MAPPSAKAPPQREAIVDKLHGALATFRRERDEVHRAKELAFERLRLVREERMASERAVQSMQNKYDQMMQSIASNGNQDDEIRKLQLETERLSREARFQHGELVIKREKMNQLNSSMKEEEKNRSEYLRLAREAVRKRREKVALQEAKTDSNDQDESVDIDLIKKCLQSSGDEQDLYSNLRRLIENNAADVETEIESISYESDLLTKRIAGYMKFIKKQEKNVGNYVDLMGIEQ